MCERVDQKIRHVKIINVWKFAKWKYGKYCIWLKLDNSGVMKYLWIERTYVKKQNKTQNSSKESCGTILVLIFNQVLPLYLSVYWVECQKIYQDLKGPKRPIFHPFQTFIHTVHLPIVKIPRKYSIVIHLVFKRDLILKKTRLTLIIYCTFCKKSLLLPPVLHRILETDTMAGIFLIWSMFLSCVECPARWCYMSNYVGIERCTDRLCCILKSIFGSVLNRIISTI